MAGLLVIIIILSIIFILVCDLDIALIAIIIMHVFAIGMCWVSKNKRKTDVEAFQPVSKLADDDKFVVSTPQQYADVVHELNTIAYNINNENYDNLTNLDDFTLSKPAPPSHEMLEELLKYDDETADYKAASMSAELAKRNKQAAINRARHNSESFRISSGLDEELDEAAERRWYDRDQLDLDM